MNNEQPTVVVVGSGYAGFHFCRQLERRLPPSAAHIVIISPVDYLLYTSLLPQVAAGVLEPRHIAVGLRDVLQRTELDLGHVVAVDLQQQTVTLRRSDARTFVRSWDRLVLGPGAVTRTFDIPGVKEHAHGLKSLAASGRIAALMAIACDATCAPSTKYVTVLGVQTMRKFALGFGVSTLELLEPLVAPDE